MGQSSNLKLQHHKLVVMAAPLQRSLTRASAAQICNTYTLLLPASYRTFSVLNRPPPKYEGHIPLTGVERGALAVGSAVMSLFNPRRAGKPSITP